MFDQSELVQYVNELVPSMSTNQYADQQQLWDLPLIGFADGSDPLFTFYQEDIGSFYWLPSEAFALKFPNTAINRLSVMSLAFPQAEETKKEQRLEKVEPAARWRYSRSSWPEFLKEFAEHLIDYLASKGIRSVCPDLLPDFAWRHSERYGLASNWSQRHTAFVAGLGTFGLSDGLITARGKAARFISIIIEADIPPTRREYGSHQDWCTYFQDGSCGFCMNRCPAGAITPDGHDKNACYAYCNAIHEKYPDDGDVGCGLCQVNVPCENRRP